MVAVSKKVEKKQRICCCKHGTDTYLNNA